MSPEQIQGKDVDQRSDLFSLGVILYEMLAGRVPFKGETEAATLSSVLSDIPEPLLRFKSGVSDDLQRIVSKLLEKDPELRYQSAGGVISDLKRLLVQTPTTVGKTPFGWWNRTVVPAAVIVLLVVAFFWLRPHRPSGDGPAIKSLVVLPFENLGAGEDEYFADGMTDEITARLAGFSGLRVISRTSAVYYKGSGKSLKEIARELKVDYVLEGTIRWDKSSDTDRVRIIPQLIRVSDDSHVWAGTFERAITKIFAVQANIAAIIADTLDITLLDREREAIEAEPTQNLEAYNYYLRGKKYWNETRQAEEAVGLINKAVELDSNFYQAYRMLAQLYGYLYINNKCDSALCYQYAKNAAENAFRLAQGDPEGYLAMGYFHYYCSRDYKSALEQFELALAGQPNNSELLEAIGYVHRRWGRWEEALANQRRALELDPRNVGTISGLTRTLFYMHRLKEVIQINEHALEWNPAYEGTLIWQLVLTIYSTDDSIMINDAIRNFDNSVGGTISDYWLEIFDVLLRDYKSALNRRSNIGNYMLGDSVEYYMSKGDIYLYLGEDAKSLIYYDSALIISEKRVADDPGDAWHLMDMASVHACLGRNEVAIKEGKAAVEMMPLSKDALDGASFLHSLAGVYIKTGEHEKAIDLLDYLLEIPSMVQVPNLKLHPMYDPLRDNPRFQVMLEKYEKIYN